MSIARHLPRRASAAPARLARVAARTRIHRRDELKSCRKLGGAPRARNDDHSAFEGLAQRLQHVARELRQLVEKQNAEVREGQLAGTQGAAADDGRDRGGMQRASKWSADRSRRLTGRRSKARHRERLIIVERREQPGQTLREHGLARTRRPHHEYSVSARGRDFQRALGHELTAHLRDVQSRGRGAAGPPRRLAQRRGALQRRTHLARDAARAEVGSGDPARVPVVRRGHDQFVIRAGAGNQRGQQLRCSAQLAGQRKLAVQLAPAHRRGAAIARWPPECRPQWANRTARPPWAGRQAIDSR